MTSSPEVVSVLEREPRDAEWFEEVARTLESHAADWVSVAGAPGSETLSRDHAWLLLAWAERAATEVANDRRRGDLVSDAAFALSLVEASPVDRRDARVVAILLHRATDLAGRLSYVDLVRAGCRRAGELGEVACPWLVESVSETPSTHEEVREGGRVEFRRRTREIDLERLERWFKREG